MTNDPQELLRQAYKLIEQAMQDDDLHDMLWRILDKIENVSMPIQAHLESLPADNGRDTEQERADYLGSVL